MLATKKQTWTIFCATGLDVRELNLSIERASELLERFNNGESADVLEELNQLGAKGTPKISKQTREAEYKQILDKANEAGMSAVKELLVEPMIVQSHKNPLDDNSPVEKQWYVPDGVCGFAWVTVHPGNCSLAKYLVKNNLAKAAYGGGVSIWVSQFNQSYQRKREYAMAYAKVLKENGFKAYAGGRLD